MSPHRDWCPGASSLYGLLLLTIRVLASVRQPQQLANEKRKAAEVAAFEAETIANLNATLDNMKGTSGGAY